MAVSKSRKIEKVSLDFNTGNEVLIRQYYEFYRPRFINFFRKKYTTEHEELIDVYQRSFTIFYQNIRKGQVKSLEINAETYLIGIGKNVLKERFRSRNKDTNIEDMDERHAAVSTTSESEEQAYKRALVKEILKNVEDPCRSILIKFYFHGYSMESITRDLGYKTEGVTKKKKCQCLQKIREKLNKAKIDL